MAKSPRIPQYPDKPHKSGSARIKIKGVEHWLGKHGTKESWAKYHTLVASILATGAPPPKVKAQEQSDLTTSITVTELVNEFRKDAEKRYVKNGQPTSEIRMYQTALKPVRKFYGNMPADRFGPADLLFCREKLKEGGYCRKKINQHLSRIRRVWKWGVPRQYISLNTYLALKTVEGFRAGEAPDLPKIRPVSMEDVEAIEEAVMPPVWAMIQFQLWTACRPGEACIVRSCDVIEDDPMLPAEVSDKVWMYRPHSFKTEHHDESERLILLGPHAQDLLRAWINLDHPQQYLFSPRESVRYVRAVRKAKRMTPGKSQYKKKKSPQRLARQCYDVESYGRAIRRACIKTNTPPWSPNQLRHTASTLIRKHYGAEVAQTILGHANLSTTEIYAEKNIEAAAKAISQVG